MRCDEAADEAVDETYVETENNMLVGFGVVVVVVDRAVRNLFLNSGNLLAEFIFLS